MSRHFLLLAAGFYVLGALMLLLPKSGRRFSWLCFLPGMAANAAVVGVRYWQAWPMLPMHLGAVALPLGVALLGGIGFPAASRSSRAERLCVALLAVLPALLAVIFPKDFYLPFLKSKTILSHLFLGFGVVGKACFLVAAAKAFVHARGLKRNTSNGPTRSEGNGFFRWVVWGFAFWTLSMFAGEIWSYRGWGTPVVWDDPAITTAMGTWFFYICFLHLHLTGTWSPATRARFAAGGALVVLVLNFFPDLGPMRMPF